MTHQYHTKDFTVGEASYNNQQNPRDCPQVGCTVFRYMKPTRCVVDKLGGAIGTYFGEMKWMCFLMTLTFAIKWMRYAL